MGSASTKTQRNGARVPPHDLEAEAAVLGAMLLSAKAIQQVRPMLRVTDFYRPVNGEIYEAICDLHAAGSPCDPVTVKDWLNRIGALERIGGIATLVELQTGTPAISNAPRYATTVAELSTLRNALRAAAEIADLAYETWEPERVVARARELVGDLTLPLGQVDPDEGLDAFLGEEDVFEWIVPGLLEKHDRVILTGHEGGGKSHALRQIALQIAAGIRPFTQTQVVDPAKVVLFDLENSAAQIRRKLRPLREMVPAMDPMNLVVKSRPRGLDLLGRSDQKWVTEHIAANKPDVVIIGPIYKLHDGDPNEEAPAKQLAAFLDDLRDRYEFALLMETHSPHGQTSRGKERRSLRPFGASLWRRWPEIGIGIDPIDDEPGQYRLGHWRGARDDRSWPTRIVKGVRGEWPWMAPIGAVRPPEVGDPFDYVDPADPGPDAAPDDFGEF